MPEGTQRIAVVDVGSNSIKLLVADFIQGIWKRTLEHSTNETRLGGALVQGDPRLSPVEIEAGAASVAGLVEKARQHQPHAVAVVATSAVRDAVNRDAFISAVRQRTGLEVRVLSGDEEAFFISEGVRCDASLNNGMDFCILDQGGGSLELIRFYGKENRRVSLQLGAVRLFTQVQLGDTGPVQRGHRQEIHRRVDEAWESIDWRRDLEGMPWVGTGGALTLTRAAMAAARGETLDGSSPRLTWSELSAFTDRIASLSLAERIQQENLPASRADILPAGLLAVLRVMERGGCSALHHSLFNLRYGYAANLASGAVQA
ncbi:MAG: hypothetical protein ACFCUX_09340 [Candidatus Methylacidiphilales bacterium]